MNDLQNVLKEASAISGDISRLEKLSTYNEYDDLSGLKINYNDCEQLLLLDELRGIMEKLDDAKRRIDYLNKTVKYTGKLHKNESGRYELENGHYYTSGSSIEVLISDDYHEAEYWAKTRVEHNCEDYYLVGYKNISLDGLIARVRK